MNKIILISLFIFQSVCFSQQNNKGLVYYGQIESTYFGSKNGIDRLATLIFDKQNSSYVSQKDSLDQITDTHTPKTSLKEGGGGSIHLGLPATQNGSQVYNSISKDSVWSSFLRGGLQYVKEKRVTQNWKLQKETKKIGNFDCHKATTKFRGREYTAWYTNEIPVPYGPWKLQGLPGLILEAYDTEKDIYYYFKSIEYPTQNPTPINFIKKPSNGSKIKWLDIKGYLNFCENHLQAQYEKIIMFDKKYPPVVPTTRGKIEEYFKEISETNSSH
jgi:GLPGLI family protein